MKEIIHFAHGNGFPALCYKQLLDHLEPHFKCCYIDKIGHNPEYPVGENWHHLVDEIIDSVKRQSKEPVIAVGHSLGGILSLLAAIKEPQLFKAVIMLDSPVIGRFKSRIVQLIKRLGLIDKMSPAQRTRGRRTYWQNHDQLVDYLKHRELFQTFTDECLNDYITYGFELRDDGYHLLFDRHTEYQIYRTLPHILPRYEGTLVTPTTLIYGDKSHVVDKMDLRYIKKRFNVCCIETRGTHLFPMEYPSLTAAHILAAISRIAAII